MIITNDKELREELHRICQTEYASEDSERNHQAFAAAHLRTQERLDAIESSLVVLARSTN